MIIVLHWSGWVEDIRVARLAAVSDAESYSSRLPQDRTSLTFDTDEKGWCERSLVWKQQYSNARMADIFNALGGERVDKFKGTDAAVRRIEVKILAMAGEMRLTIIDDPMLIVDMSTHGERNMPAKQVNETSTLGKILKAYFASNRTVMSLSAAAEMPFDKVLSRLKSAKASHGIHHSIEIGTGVIDLILPTDANDETIFRTAKAPRTPSATTRERKVGDFRAVRRGSGLGKLVEAASAGLNLADVAIMIGSTEDEATAKLKSLQRTHGMPHVVDDNGIVSLVLPIDADPFIAVSAEATPAREPTALSKILKAYSDSENKTIMDISAAAEMPFDKVLAHLKSAKARYGIDHNVEVGTGVVTVTFPPGTDEDTVFQAQGRAPRLASGEPRRGKNKDLDDLAASGVPPVKPIVTSESNKHRQKHFDKLARLADDGAWDEISTYTMNGIDSYSAMIRRYRDRLLAAHNAERAQAAE